MQPVCKKKSSAFAKLPTLLDLPQSALIINLVRCFIIVHLPDSDKQLVI